MQFAPHNFKLRHPHRPDCRLVYDESIGCHHWESGGRERDLKSHWNAKGSTLELWVYDEVGPQFMGFSAADVRDALSDGPFKNIDLHINSPGGDVFEGIAAYNLLHQHGATVNVDIDGQAASIASVIAMAGDRIRIAEAGSMMIHNPWTLAMGEAKDFRKIADLLEDVKGQLAGVYAKRTGLEVGPIGEMMDEETTMMAKETVGMGFADEMIGNKAKPAAAQSEEWRTNMLKRYLACM